MLGRTETMYPEYPNFGALIDLHNEGKSFDRVMILREEAKAIILAPHGGRIEPYTAEIAQAIAEDAFSLYCFRSKVRRTEANLHITSHHFDDPDCLSLVSKHKTAIAIHGCQGHSSEVFLGGLDFALIAVLASNLHAAGISVQTNNHPYQGTHPMNICNRSSSGAGAQFELTMPFRKGQAVASFVATIRSVLRAWHSAA